LRSSRMHMGGVDYDVINEIFKYYVVV